MVRASKRRLRRDGSAKCGFSTIVILARTADVTKIILHFRRARLQRYCFSKCLFCRLKVAHVIQRSSEFVPATGIFPDTQRILVAASRRFKFTGKVIQSTKLNQRIAVIRLVPNTLLPFPNPVLQR